MTAHLYPGNFGEKEMEAAKGTKLSEEIVDRNAHITMCYNRIRAYLFQNSKIDFQMSEKEYSTFW